MAALPAAGPRTHEDFFLSETYLTIAFALCVFTALSAVIWWLWQRNRRHLVGLFQAKKELFDAQTRLQAIMDGVEEHIHVIAPDGTVLWRNRSARGGHSESIGRKCWKVFEGREDRCPHCVHPQILRNGLPQEYEGTFKAPDGTSRDWWVHAAPLRNDRGEIYAILETARDVTSRNQNERALRDNEARFRTLFEQAGMGIAIVGTDGRILAANPALQELLGYTEKELAFLSPKDFTHPADFASERDAVRHFMAGKQERIEIEKRYVRKDGRVLWGRLTMSKACGADGAALFVVAMIENIETQKQQRDALQSSEARFRALLEGLPTGAVIVSENGDIEYVNPLATEIMGYTMQELPTLERWWQRVYRSPEEVNNARERWMRLTEDLQKKPRVARQELEVLAADGKPRIVVSHITRVNRSYVITLSDVTAVRRSQDQIRHAHKLEALGQLAGGVAHDFNNLLHAIQGYAELTRRMIAPGHPSQECLDQVSKASERAALLVRHLLVFSRQEPRKPKPLDLNETVCGVLKVLQRLIGEHVLIEFRQADHLPAVEADTAQIEQVLMNLCANARDAMPEGGTMLMTTAEVQLDDSFAALNPWSRPGRFVRLTVSDSGVGMPPEVLEHLFEPFFTTKDSGKGTGLGLATVYGIIKQHNGLIHCNSRPGAGTTFSLYFPASEANQVPAPTEELTAQTPPPANAGVVLLAEDDDAVVTLTATMLRKGGYAVLTAADGREAVDVFRRHRDRIGLALLDVVMPGLSGPAVARQLHAARPALPVLYCSGYDQDALFSRMGLAADAPLLRKPFTQTELLGRVAAAMSHSPKQGQPTLDAAGRD